MTNKRLFWIRNHSFYIQILSRFLWCLPNSTHKTLSQGEQRVAEDVFLSDNSSLSNQSDQRTGLMIYNQQRGGGYFLVKKQHRTTWGEGY